MKGLWTWSWLPRTYTYISLMFLVLLIRACRSLYVWLEIKEGSVGGACCVCTPPELRRLYQCKEGMLLIWWSACELCLHLISSGLISVPSLRCVTLWRSVPALQRLRHVNRNTSATLSYTYVPASSFFFPFQICCTEHFLPFAHVCWLKAFSIWCRT